MVPRNRSAQRGYKTPENKPTSLLSFNQPQNILSKSSSSNENSSQENPTKQQDICSAPKLSRVNKALSNHPRTKALQGHSKIQHKKEESKPPQEQSSSNLYSEPSLSFPHPFQDTKKSFFDLLTSPPIKNSSSLQESLFGEEVRPSSSSSGMGLFGQKTGLFSLYSQTAPSQPFLKEFEPKNPSPTFHPTEE